MLLSRFAQAACRWWTNTSQGGTKSRHKRSPRYRPNLEPLEARLVLSRVLLVTEGEGDLAALTAALVDAGALAPDVQIDSESVINLSFGGGFLYPYEDTPSAFRLPFLEGEAAYQINSGPQYGVLAFNPNTGLGIYQPDLHYSGDDQFTYSFNFLIGAVPGESPDVSGMSDFEETVSIFVFPVADDPDISVADVSGFEGTPIPLDIQAQLVDQDGSESVFYILEGAPSDAVFSNGVVFLNLMGEEDPERGSYAFITQEQLEGLTVTVPNETEFTLTLTAIVSEDDFGEEFFSPPLVRSVSFQVLVLNAPPSFGPFEDVTLQVGTPFVFDFSFTDPGDDSWTAEVDYATGNGFEPLALEGKSATLSNTFNREADFIVLIRISDGTDTVTRTLVVHTFEVNQFASISDIDTDLLEPGETTTTVQAGDPNQGPAVRATLDLGLPIGNHVSVLVATFDGNPVSPARNTFQVENGREVNALAYVDVRVTGLDEQTVNDLVGRGQSPNITVEFTFRVPSNQVDQAQLFFFDGTVWVAAVNGLREGRDQLVPPTRVITHNGDGTSTASLTYVFNHLSNPRLWELGGTVFTVAVPTMPAPPIPVTLPTPAQAGLTAVPPTFSTNVIPTTTVTLTVRVSTSSDVAVSRSTTEVSSSLASPGVGGDPNEDGEGRSRTPPSDSAGGGFLNFQWILDLFRQAGAAQEGMPEPEVVPAEDGVGMDDGHLDNRLPENSGSSKGMTLAPEVLDTIFAQPDTFLDLPQARPPVNGLGFCGLALMGAAWGRKRPERKAKRELSRLSHRGA